ncbi:hypothetical protein [Methanothermococcus sp.]|uniref:hypothetical protein n=1 Tax=Methanothermococcus sp. TaxID=2614238 RepID=UPI0025D1BB9B|nr:hypothetical protein [Methanothermococcus sp.]
MKINEELKILSERLEEIFHKVYEILKNKELTDRTLDYEVLNILKKYEIAEDNLKIKFSEPNDEIYSVEGGRTPYDLLCYGKINKKEFVIFINNKYGNLNSTARNDVTTYNNLLRLYLGIDKQRLTSKITIDGDLIYRRVSGKEIVAYAVFVVDNKKRGFNFFLLEEIYDEFYINPRNTMFQIKYRPSIESPMDYYSFVIKLINSILKSLQKSINSIETEIIVLNAIKEQILKLKGTEHE